MATRIAILYRTTKGPWGGGNSFLRSLKKTWQTSGVEVVDRLQAGLDGVLINSSFLGAGPGLSLSPDTARRMVKQGYCSTWAAWLGQCRWKKSGSRPAFVHRLDGVFRLYGRPANDPEDSAQLGINRHMDWTIFQSQFCRQSFFAEGADVLRSSVVYNGVDLDHFFPAEWPPDMGPLKLIMVSWSPNLRKGAPDAVRASHISGVEVTFVGNWPAGLNPGQVKVIPPRRHDVLSVLLRGHHALLHMAQNDPCSNAILEGIASGLPVIYHPSGGNPEIVRECGVACIESLQDAVFELRDRYNELREKTLARRPELSIDRAAQQYLDVFQGVGKIAVS